MSLKIMLMVLFGIIIKILAIGLLRLLTNFNYKPCRHYRITTIWGIGFPRYVGWTTRFGVGIFYGLFQVTAVTQGIDLFIYILINLVLFLIVYKCYRLNNEEPA